MNTNLNNHQTDFKNNTLTNNCMKTFTQMTLGEGAGKKGNGKILAINQFRLFLYWTLVGLTF